MMNPANAGALWCSTAWERCCPPLIPVDIFTCLAGGRNSMCKHGRPQLAQVEEIVSRTAAGLPQSSRLADKEQAAAPIWNMHAASFKVTALACSMISWEPYATRPARCCHHSLLS